MRIFYLLNHYWKKFTHYNIANPASVCYTRPIVRISKYLCFIYVWIVELFLQSMKKKDDKAMSQNVLNVYRRIVGSKNSSKATNYNVLDVCRHVINYSNERNYGISNLKLQKILYFVQAYFLINTKDNTPCFCEKIEAWDFGPVVPEAYCEYKQYGSGNIPTIKSYILFDKENIWNSKRVKFEDTIISDDDKKLIDTVVDMFADYSATDLVSITHSQSPWIDVYERRKNNEITTDAIREYFNGR